MTRGAVALTLVLAAACTPTPPPRPGGPHVSDADVTVTRLLHAGVLLQLGDQHFLVDPWLYDGVLVRQREPLGLHPDVLPRAAAVLLTADTGTRLDASALARLARTVPLLVVPQSLAAPRHYLGFDTVRSLGWWDTTDIGPTRVTAVPAHGNGYLLQHGRHAVVVAGVGTDATAAAEIRRAAGPNAVALVPIGSEGPLRAASGAEDAATVARALDAARIIPIGYAAGGVHEPTADRTVARFRDALAAAGVDPATLVVLETGESWHYYR